MVGVGSACPEVGGLEFLKVPPEEAEVRRGGEAWVRGRVCVVEMWASWCPPCRNVAPHLSGIARRFRSRGLCVVGVTSEDRGAVAGFVAGHKEMDYAVAVDAGGQVQARLAGPAGVRGIPHAFVVDARGRVAYSGHPADPGFERAVEAAVEQGGHERVAQKPPIPGNVVVGSADEVAAMGVGQLKRMLAERQVRFEDCREKGELVARALEKCVTVRGGAGDAPREEEEEEVVVEKRQAEHAEQGGGGHERVAQKPPIPGNVVVGSADEVAAMGVGQLKRMLAERQVRFEDCREKGELVARALEKCVTVRPAGVVCDGDVCWRPAAGDNA